MASSGCRSASKTRPTCWPTWSKPYVSSQLSVVSSQKDRPTDFWLLTTDYCVERRHMLNVSQRPRYLRTDLHLHSTFSDGRSSVAQLVERANSIGFVFAISDHYSSLMPMKDDATLGVYLDELEKYPVYRAVEMDLGEQLPMSEDNRARLDYLIGSVHNVVTETGERLPISRQGEPEGGLDRYMDLYIAAVRRDVLAGTVQMIGHPTFLPGIRSGLHDRLWTPERRRSFLEAIVQSGVALEIS